MKKIIIGVALLAVSAVSAQTVTTATTNLVVTEIQSPVVTTISAQTGNQTVVSYVTNMVASWSTNQVVNYSVNTPLTGTPAVPTQSQVPNLIGSLGVNVGGISIGSISSMLQNGIITVGTPISINGQGFLVTTNSLGLYSVYTYGAAGTNTVNQPTSVTGALTSMGQLFGQNDPTHANYYGTNEIVVRVAMDYLQNSGKAVIEIGLEKYGLLSSVPQLGLGVALFQGNNGGQSGTAGAVAYVDYRKIIGSVALDIGVGGGYDNWNKSAMGVVKVDIELRQGPHIGEFAGVGYAFEGKVSGPGGLIARAGVNYAFASLNPFSPAIAAK